MSIVSARRALPVPDRAAEDDFTFPHAARRRAEDILVARKATYFIQIFGGASHGFATRPDPAVRGDRECRTPVSRDPRIVVARLMMCGMFLFRMGEGGERARSREVVRPPCGGVGAVGNKSRPQQQASDDSDTDSAEDPRGSLVGTHYSSLPLDSVDKTRKRLLESESTTAALSISAVA